MRRVALVVPFVIASACGIEDPGADESFQTATTIAEGSTAAVALLAFVNDPLVDAAALKAAGATTPVSRAIVAHRDGTDAVAGTDDDDAFDTVKEVDAIPGVGPATLQKLAARASTLGYGSARGTYLGVYFTEKQAHLTLALANEATVDELDDDASLDARAAENVVAARPIVSIDALAKVSRIKASALRLLRDHADRTRRPPLCDAATSCAGDLFCTAGGAGPGYCVDTSVEGAGEPCSSAGTCGADLVCAGRRDDFAGICNPAWMKDEHVSESQGSIPDGPNGSTGVGVTVFGLATVPTDAVVHVVVDHPRPEDVELELTNPTGTTVLVWPRGAGAVPESIAVVVPGDESANGDWVLTAKDTVAGSVGTLGRFGLELTTRFD